MHITRYTDYSLRVLIYLAVQGDRLATIQEIADSYDISKNHLMKVVHQLNKKGYIETIRGKKGGMRLHRAPSDINVGILVRETRSKPAGSTRSGQRASTVCPSGSRVSIPTISKRWGAFTMPMPPTGPYAPLAVPGSITSISI